MPSRVRLIPSDVVFCMLIDCPTSFSKFPDNPDATHAFQKVAVAYDVLSKPNLKRLYDNRSPSSEFDAFATRPSGHAEETFRGVIIGVFNDFLDGDLEVIRTLLSTHGYLMHSMKRLKLTERF